MTTSVTGFLKICFSTSVLFRPRKGSFFLGFNPGYFHPRKCSFFLRFNPGYFHPRKCSFFLCFNPGYFHPRKGSCIFFFPYKIVYLVCSLFFLTRSSILYVLFFSFFFSFLFSFLFFSFSFSLPGGAMPSPLKERMGRCCFFFFNLARLVFFPLDGL